MRWSATSTTTSRRSRFGYDHGRQPVYLKDIWPTQAEVAETVLSSIGAEMFKHQYSTVTDGDQNWQNLAVPTGDTYGWEPGFPPTSGKAPLLRRHAGGSGAG